MIKLYGSPVSTCTRKVLMTLNETNTPYEMNVIDFASGAHKKEPHVHRQPFGRIPAIDDDGFEMFESRAICRYINEKASGNLEPKDVKGRARMEQFISIEMSEFTAHAMKFVYEYVFKRPQEAGALELASKALKHTNGVLEAQLAKGPYLAGSDFSIADISYMPYIEYVMMTPGKENFADFPNVTKWWNTISARPAWQKTIGKS